MVNYNIENEIIDKHRVVTKEYRNNILVKSYHTFDGTLFHPSQPADIEYYQNGNIKRETYVCTNEHHSHAYRKNGPAIIEYYINGNIKSEFWSTDPLFYPHRKDGPAVIYYNINGTIKDEFYYSNGKLIEDELTIEMIKTLTKIERENNC